jgi:6-phosphofructokinase 1
MEAKARKPDRLGILVSGGPAPGINGVIEAATTEAIRNHLEVVGIYDGFKCLAQGEAGHTQVLTAGGVEGIRFRGGSILRTSRENPTTDEGRMRNVVRTLMGLQVRNLVTIGGDDTASSAVRTCQCAEGGINVAHVPKTIDNDLPLPGNVPTFGFQTARDVGGQLVRNLVEDARSARRWYVVVAMGRTAGHLALGMGSVGGAPLTIIPEEFARGGVSLELLCDTIEGAVVKGKALGRDHGVVVVAEGLGDLLKDELKSHPFVVVSYDKARHLRLAEVPLALILKRMLQERAKNRGEEMTWVDVTIGYEVRCADPVPSDLVYVRQLGWGAVRYLLDAGDGQWPRPGAMISVRDGRLEPIAFADILDTQTGKTAVRKVDITSDFYRCLRSSMVRLEPEDLLDERRLAELAGVARLEPIEFRAKYAGVVGL